MPRRLGYAGFSPDVVAILERTGPACACQLSTTAEARTHLKDSCGCVQIASEFATVVCLPQASLTARTRRSRTRWMRRTSGHPVDPGRVAGSGLRASRLARGGWLGARHASVTGGHFELLLTPHWPQPVAASTADDPDIPTWPSRPYCNRMAGRPQSRLAMSACKRRRAPP